ncbi:hypothetical protein Ciccas_009742, partial [Cichlidogyrus casuarinus]
LRIGGHCSNPCSNKNASCEGMFWLVAMTPTTADDHMKTLDKTGCDNECRLKTLLVYLEEPLMKMESSSFVQAFIKSPRLHKVAIFFNTQMASSAESERLFSTAKRILTPHRLNASDETLEAQILLLNNNK